MHAHVHVYMYTVTTNKIACSNFVWAGKVVPAQYICYGYGVLGVAIQEPYMFVTV